MKRCYVLLVNWNGWTDTVECLESLFRCEYPNLKVIVCDNGSSDDSLSRLREWAQGKSSSPPVPGSPLKELVSQKTTAKPVSFVEYDRDEAEEGGDSSADPELVLIDTGANLGFAGGNNVGLRYLLARADFDYVWLLNNDTVAEPHALTSLVERMEKSSEIGICGSTLLHYETPDKVQARGGAWYCKWVGLPWHLGQLGDAAQKVNIDQVERWMTYVLGASMFVSRQFLEDVGLMNEEYFLYYEELDWAFRGRGKFSFAYAPDSIVYHKVGRSVGTRTNPCQKSLTSDFYTIRNRLLFTRKFLPWALPSIYLSVLTAMFVRLLVGRWSHAKMIWRVLAGREGYV